MVNPIEDLALWKAEQALKEGEKSIISQETLLDSIRSQASSLTQWTIAVTAFLIGAATSLQLYAAAALSALACCFTAYHASKALEEVGWYHSALDPTQFLDHPKSTKQEIMEDIARGQQASIVDNNQTLAILISNIQQARVCFRLIPLFFLAGMFIQIMY